MEWTEEAGVILSADDRFEITDLGDCYALRTLADGDWDYVGDYESAGAAKAAAEAVALDMTTVETVQTTAGAVSLWNDGTSGGMTMLLDHQSGTVTWYEDDEEAFAAIGGRA